MSKHRILYVIVGAVLIFCSIASAQQTAYIPPELETWKEWVRYGNERYYCPSLYNEQEEHVCLWPDTLELDFRKEGGFFKQSWTVLAPSSWIPLPGDTVFWPMHVSVDGSRLPVVLHEGMPAINVSEGRHTVSGEFLWNSAIRQIPQSFPIPPLTGLVDLTVDGQKKQTPFIDENSRIWIHKPAGTDSDLALQKVENAMDIRIFRLIEDTVPLQLHNLLRLTVSGDRRRVKLSSVLLKDSVAVSVASPLPVKLTSEGDLWVEVKPGQWEIRIRSILNQPAETLGPVAASYGNEIWSFKPHPNLRLVSVAGPSAIDPEQSTMPDEWKQYTSFLVKKEDVIRFKETQRGSPKTVADALNLNREIWLDFDGSGLTVRDRISGLLGQRRFLGMSDGNYQLGRLIVNGKDQLVTRLNEEQPGIEMEKGSLNLTAVSRIDPIRSGQNFTIGWNNTFQSAKGVLHLPPGWHLLGVRGGNVPSNATWVDRWSLLDFFLILVLAFAVAKLWRWWWGLLFAFGLSLIWQETYAPQYVWLHLVITTALMRFLRERESEEKVSFWMKALKIWHLAAVVVLISVGLIFVYVQLRAAIYPQLEARWPRHYYAADMDAGAPPVSVYQKKDKIVGRMAAPTKSREQVEESLPMKNKKYYLTTDQNVVTQTGPGIPNWKWKTVSIDYGQVAGTRNVAFWLLSPFKNSLVSIARVVLLLILAFRFFNIRLLASIRKNRWIARSALIMLVIAGWGEAQPAFGAFPSQHLLDELEKRLMKPDDCFPHCAEISEARIYVRPSAEKEGDRSLVRIELEVNAAVKTAIPLPSGSGTWKPFNLLLDDKPHSAVIKKKNELWTWVPQGIHTLAALGVAGGNDQLRIAFPLPPHYVDVDAPGWESRGLDDAHQVSNLLVLRRKQQEKGADEKKTSDLFFADESSGLSDFLRVRRTLLLGLEWRVLTEVERFASFRNQRPVVAAIPLLKGELVSSESLKISDGVVHIEMPPDVNRIEWRSSIPIAPAIDLNVPETANWAEIWHLDASSLWHYTFQGMPAVYQDDQSGIYWYPWPGETLKIDVAKLPAAAGESLTIDALRADYYIGEEYNRIVLDAKIRTSQGKLHSLVGPEDAVLKHIKINGRTLPVSDNPKRLLLPLQPGSQAVEIEWSQPVKQPLSWFLKMIVPQRLVFPEIDMTREVNNIDMYWHLPLKLWLLTTHGPRLGPAVLFWSYLAVIALSAVLLGRFAPSPLKTHQWFLLGIGMATLDVKTAVLVAGWFIAVELRKKKLPSSPIIFNLMQIGLVVWSLVVAISFFHAVQNGLLGIPDMQVVGNGSQSRLLHWTADRAEGIIPRPRVIVWSLYIYRAAMFCWALWLAKNTVLWSKWAVRTLRHEGAWRKHALKALKKHKNEN